MVTVDGRKRCPGCGETKVAAQHFYASKTTKDGYVSACKRCVAARVTAWKKRNPEKATAYRHSRRKAESGSAIAPAEWREVLDGFGRRCCYCGASGALSLDHLTSVARGGATAVGNIAPACRPCNESKGSRSVEEFRPELAAEIRRRACLGRASAKSEPPPPPTPKKVRLLRNYQYYGGELGTWYQGQVVTDHRQIEVLLRINAPVVAIG